MLTVRLKNIVSNRSTEIPATNVSPNHLGAPSRTSCVAFLRFDKQLAMRSKTNRGAGQSKGAGLAVLEPLLSSTPVIDDEQEPLAIASKRDSEWKISVGFPSLG